MVKINFLIPLGSYSIPQWLETSHSEAGLCLTNRIYLGNGEILFEVSRIISKTIALRTGHSLQKQFICPCTYVPYITKRKYYSQISRLILSLIASLEQIRQNRYTFSEQQQEGWHTFTIEGGKGCNYKAVSYLTAWGSQRGLL